MDIASRIKLFMDTAGIQNSQFADTCGIPRPSLSQLLNGRNKKVSNEVIDKIHEAYPSLSIMWLMFGEGDMWIDGNIQFSGAENTEKKSIDSSASTGNERITYEDNLFSSVTEIASEKSEQENIPASPFSNDNFKAQRVPATPSTPTTLSLGVDGTRRVVNIMVFYSDNSFETFVPKPQ